MSATPEGLRSGEAVSSEGATGRVERVGFEVEPARAVGGTATAPAPAAKRYTDPERESSLKATIAFLREEMPKIFSSGVSRSLLPAFARAAP